MLLSMCPRARGHPRVHGRPTSGHSPQRKIALPHLSANNCSARDGPWEPLPTQHSKCCLPGQVFCALPLLLGVAI